MSDDLELSVSSPATSTPSKNLVVGVLFSDFFDDDWNWVSKFNTQTNFTDRDVFGKKSFGDSAGYFP